MLDKLHELEDHLVLEQLTGVKGIGTWTAEIFLLFRLQRPDVFPVDDLGLVKAAQKVYGLRQRPTRKKLLPAVGNDTSPSVDLSKWRR